MDSFTPFASTIGGILIGTASAGLLMFHGRIAGISGIAGGIFRNQVGDVTWRVMFLAGLFAAGMLGSFVYPEAYRVGIDRSTIALVVAGVAVGIGTQLGSGCTSGHGVCGLGRLSKRSAVATVSFMATAAITVTIINLVFGVGMKIKLGAFLGGLLFGVGLAVSGMTQPAKIVGFFDFFGSWDPSLAFVMLGALLVYTPIYRAVVGKWSRPIWAQAFSLPTRKDIDGRLIAGSALFGVGWGLGGYCPGPAFTSVGARSEQALIFGAAMIVGVGVYQIVQRMREPKPKLSADAPAATTVTDG